MCNIFPTYITFIWCWIHSKLNSKCCRQKPNSSRITALKLIQYHVNNFDFITYRHSIVPCSTEYEHCPPPQPSLLSSNTHGLLTTSCTSTGINNDIQFWWQYSAGDRCYLSFISLYLCLEIQLKSILSAGLMHSSNILWRVYISRLESDSEIKVHRM